MIRHTAIKHEFVECFPDRMQPGVLYISMEYATASHLCCCGCGEEVVTPFAPTEWKMTFDGESIALWPSIGNWNLPCRSHYIIRDGRALEVAPWSDQQIASEQQRDRQAKDAYYNQRKQELPVPSVEDTPEFPVKSRWFRSSVRWLLRQIGC